MKKRGKILALAAIVVVGAVVLSRCGHKNTAVEYESRQKAADKAAKAAAAKPEDEKLAKAAEVAAQAAKDAADGTKIPETFKDYLQKYVYGCKDQDDLLNVLGGARLMNLKNEPHLGYSTRH